MNQATEHTFPQEPRALADSPGEHKKPLSQSIAVGYATSSPGTSASKTCRTGFITPAHASLFLLVVMVGPARTTEGPTDSDSIIYIRHDRGIPFFIGEGVQRKTDSQRCRPEHQGINDPYGAPMKRCKTQLIDPTLRRPQSTFSHLHPVSCRDLGACRQTIRVTPSHYTQKASVMDEL